MTTDTHSEYASLMLVHERASVLHYTYIACTVFYSKQRIQIHERVFFPIIKAIDLRNLVI